MPRSSKVDKRPATKKQIAEIRHLEAQLRRNGSVINTPYQLVLSVLSFTFLIGPLWESVRSLPVVQERVWNNLLRTVRDSHDIVERGMQEIQQAYTQKQSEVFAKAEWMWLNYETRDPYFLEWKSLVEQYSKQKFATLDQAIQYMDEDQFDSSIMHLRVDFHSFLTDLISDSKPTYDLSTLKSSTLHGRYEEVKGIEINPWIKEQYSEYINSLPQLADTKADELLSEVDRDFKQETKHLSEHINKTTFIPEVLSLLTLNWWIGRCLNTRFPRGFSLWEEPGQIQLPDDPTRTEADAKLRELTPLVSHSNGRAQSYRNFIRACFPTLLALAYFEGFSGTPLYILFLVSTITLSSMNAVNDVVIIPLQKRKYSRTVNNIRKALEIILNDYHASVGLRDYDSLQKSQFVLDFEAGTSASNSHNQQKQYCRIVKTVLLQHGITINDTYVEQLVIPAGSLSVLANSNTAEAIAHDISRALERETGVKKLRKQLYALSDTFRLSIEIENDLEDGFLLAPRITITIPQQLQATFTEALQDLTPTTTENNDSEYVDITIVGTKAIANDMFAQLRQSMAKSQTAASSTANKPYTDTEGYKQTQSATSGKRRRKAHPQHSTHSADATAAASNDEVKASISWTVFGKNYTPKSDEVTIVRKNRHHYTLRLFDETDCRECPLGTYKKLEKLVSGEPQFIGPRGQGLKNSTDTVVNDQGLSRAATWKAKVKGKSTTRLPAYAVKATGGEVLHVFDGRNIISAAH